MSSAKDKNISGPVQLRDVLDEIMRVNKWTQDDLGKKIGVTQSNVSKMRLGPDWEFHWGIFWKLMELCSEAGFEARNLKRPTDEEVFRYAEYFSKAPRRNVRRRKKGHGTETERPLPTSGTVGSEG